MASDRRSFFALALGFVLPSLAAAQAGKKLIVVTSPHPRCSSCKFFDSADSTCKRFPPPTAAFQVPHGVIIFPQVKPTHWCGEYAR